MIKIDSWELAFFILIYIVMFLSMPIILSAREIIKKVRLFFNSKLVITEILDRAGNSEEWIYKPKGDFIEVGKKKYLIHPDFFIQRGKHRKMTIIDGVVMPSMYYINFDFQNYLMSEEEVETLTEEQKAQYEKYVQVAREKYDRLLKYSSETLDNHIANAKLSSKIGQFQDYEKKIYMVAIAIAIGILICIVLVFIFYNDMTPFIRAGFNPTNARNGIISV